MRIYGISFSKYQMCIIYDRDGQLNYRLGNMEVDDRSPTRKTNQF